MEARARRRGRCRPGAQPACRAKHTAEWWGNGSAARTTTTTYDDPSTSGVNESYSGLPVSFTQPAATTGATPLSESASYNYRMGTLLSVTDVNANVTSGTYDVFGRLVSVIKPGDSTTYPTVQAYYYDTEQPFRYRIERREAAGQAGVRVEQQFYDGLGRKIQVKSESSDGTSSLVNVVTDMRYDGLGRVVEQSQPRYVTETSTTFTQYTNPGTGALSNPTTTSYDALGRVLSVTVPNSPSATRTTTHSYGLSQDAGGTI